MNYKRLYIWYIAIVAVLLLSTVVRFSAVVKVFFSGYDVAYETIIEHDNDKGELPMVWAGSNIKIAPEDLKSANLPIKLESSDNDSKVELTPTLYKVLASGDLGNKSKIATLSGIQAFIALLVLVMFVLVFVLAVCLIIKINAALNRKEIFDIRVIKSMRCIGWMLLVQATVNMAFGYSQAVIGRIVLMEYDIDVMFFDGIDYTRFLLAFVTLMIAEIFKIGYHIREEQSLTI